MDAVQGIFSLGMSIGQVPTQLHEELEQLQLKLPSARLLICRSEWGMFRNRELEALVLQLKYTTYDAEDLLRQFEDQALRQKVENAGRSSTGQLMSSSLNIAKHFILASRERVKNTQDKLDKVMAEVEKVLDLMGLDRVEPVQFMPTTTEVITAPQVFGRDTERDQLMEVLGVTTTINRDGEINQVITQLGVPLSAGSKRKRRTAAGCGNLASTRKSCKGLRGSSSSSAPIVGTTNFPGNVSVLPIFGIGGMGKTTLAQLIYNDQRVKVHFTERIWVCVSDLFDTERMIKEIFKAISGPNSSCNLTDLQAKLKEHLKSQKFLLVLDDIWQIALQKWESFYAYLRDGLEGSMILVTTRHENIAELVATRNCKPVQLNGLPTNIFWEFFKKCAFGKEQPESYPHLQVIGRRISSKLCGTPLAAKTLGRLLNCNLTEEHWDSIDNSELWQQEQQEGDILPALRLSYLYLRPELRKCFAFCSMFPKDYSFERNEIVDIWVAQGFVAPLGNMRLEDIGIRYLDELRGRCLFQNDPKFSNNQNRYVMHDLIHDTAQHVSLHECFLMTDLSNLGRHEFRHMSVEVGDGSFSTTKNIQYLNKLRSLRFGNGTILYVEMTWFSLLSNILFLSLKGCNLKELPESICELSSLRYLDISNSEVRNLPPNFWCLYSLQIVNASGSHIKTVHQDVTKLINLRQLSLPVKASMALSKVPGLGNLSCLRNLSYFTVGRQSGRTISELKGMNQLSGTLCIRSIHAVKSREEAAAAGLVDMKYLKELDLHWRIERPSERSTSENEVMDGLWPSKRIQHLKVHGFGGDRLPIWFIPQELQNLRIMELSCCCYFETLSTPHFTSGNRGGSTRQHASSSANFSNAIASLAFTHLTAISIDKCDRLKNLDQFLSPTNLPSVESISLRDCCNLESIPADSFVGFVNLRDLKLCRCSSLVCPQPREMVLPPSLQRLYIDSCGQLDRSFPSCLEKLASLTILCLIGCGNVESIPLDSIPCRNTLKFLLLGRCDKLSSIGGSGIPPSIEYVHVYDCPKLTQVPDDYRKKALYTTEPEEIKRFLYMQYWSM